MHVLFIRHAVAELREEFAATGKDDAFRPLSDQGRRKMQRAVRGLKALVPRLRLVATSPLTRAVETAQIVCQAYGNLKRVKLDALCPESPVEDLLPWLRSQRGETPVALVGHEPHMSCAISWLLTGASTPIVVMKKGAACLIEAADSDDGEEARLRWLLQPAQLRMLAES
jgi:phosphohistidine phosphatase